jgi:hypothetical protein
MPPMGPMCLCYLWYSACLMHVLLLEPVLPVLPMMPMYAEIGLWIGRALYTTHITKHTYDTCQMHSNAKNEQNLQIMADNAATEWMLYTFNHM